MLLLKNYSIRIFQSAFLTVALLTSCNPTLNITGMDISSIYNGQKGSSIQLSQLYHISDSLSTITVELPGGLMSSEAKISKFGILKYEVIGEGKQIGITDSATFVISDTIESLSYISHTWTFNAPAGIRYFIKATYTIKGIQDDFLLLEYFSKTNHLTQSWYRFQSESGEFISGNISAYPQPVRMVTEDTVNRKFIVKYYSRNFAPPIPPFIVQYRSPFNYKPDSTFTLEINKGISTYFTPAKPGFYFFQTDSSKMEGPTLFRVYNGFPKVTAHTMMRDALRYITSGKEFQQLNSYLIPKVAVDSFWIVNAGRSDLATELIRKYYLRVETANKLYTSFTEGWNTDRGMVFIVMGKPTKVFRAFDEEIWLYGQIDDPRALRFYFNKANNPFTNNDYVLSRSENYKSYWFQNVQLWRR